MFLFSLNSPTGVRTVKPKSRNRVLLILAQGRSDPQTAVKFQVAGPNHSRVISKSLKFCIRSYKMIK